MPTFNKRTYAVMPIGKAAQYIKANIEDARKSLNGSLIIWDENWDQETLHYMKIDPDVELLTHEQAIELTSGKDWQDPAEQ